MKRFTITTFPLENKTIFLRMISSILRRNHFDVFLYILYHFVVPLMINDIVIIISYGIMDFEIAKTFKPTLVFPDENTNQLK